MPTRPLIARQVAFMIVDASHNTLFTWLNRTVKMCCVTNPELRYAPYVSESEVAGGMLTTCLHLRWKR
jgi:hypothetical protein